eukprot:scaffold129022_cov67-Cyclotella_meneghiniana.AAC.2
MLVAFQALHENHYSPLYQGTSPKHTKIDAVNPLPTLIVGQREICCVAFEDRLLLDLPICLY